MKAELLLAETGVGKVPTHHTECGENYYLILEQWHVCACYIKCMWFSETKGCISRS